MQSSLEDELTMSLKLHCITIRTRTWLFHYQIDKKSGRAVTYMVQQLDKQSSLFT